MRLIVGEYQLEGSDRAAAESKTSTQFLMLLSATPLNDVQKDVWGILKVRDENNDRRFFRILLRFMVYFKFGHKQLQQKFGISSIADVHVSEKKIRRSLNVFSDIFSNAIFANTNQPLGHFRFGRHDQPCEFDELGEYYFAAVKGLRFYDRTILTQQQFNWRILTANSTDKFGISDTAVKIMWFFDNLRNVQLDVGRSIDSVASNTESEVADVSGGKAGFYIYDDQDDYADYMCRMKIKRNRLRPFSHTHIHFPLFPFNRVTGNGTSNGQIQKPKKHGKSKSKKQHDAHEQDSHKTKAKRQSEAPTVPDDNTDDIMDEKYDVGSDGVRDDDETEGDVSDDDPTDTDVINSISKRKQIKKQQTNQDKKNIDDQTSNCASKNSNKDDDTEQKNLYDQFGDVMNDNDGNEPDITGAPHKTPKTAKHDDLSETDVVTTSTKDILGQMRFIGYGKPLALAAINACNSNSVGEIFDWAQQHEAYYSDGGWSDDEASMERDDEQVNECTTMDLSREDGDLEFAHMAILSGMDRALDKAELAKKKGMKTRNDPDRNVRQLLNSVVGKGSKYDASLLAINIQEFIPAAKMRASHKCKRCRIPFSTAESKNVHESICHLKKHWSCPYCPNKTFRSVLKLEQHMDEHLRFRR